MGKLQAEGPRARATSFLTLEAACLYGLMVGDSNL